MNHPDYSPKKSQEIPWYDHEGKKDFYDVLAKTCVEGKKEVDKEHNEYMLHMEFGHE